MHPPQLDNGSAREFGQRPDQDPVDFRIEGYAPALEQRIGFRFISSGSEKTPAVYDDEVAPLADTDRSRVRPGTHFARRERGHQPDEVLQARVARCAARALPVFIAGAAPPIRFSQAEQQVAKAMPGRESAQRIARLALRRIRPEIVVIVRRRIVVRYEFSDAWDRGRHDAQETGRNLRALRPRRDPPRHLRFEQPRPQRAFGPAPVDAPDFARKPQGGRAVPVEPEVVPDVPFQIGGPADMQRTAAFAIEYVDAWALGQLLEQTDIEVRGEHRLCQKGTNGCQYRFRRKIPAQRLPKTPHQPGIGQRGA